MPIIKEGKEEEEGGQCGGPRGGCLIHGGDQS